jgi:hypothetical protein
MPIRSRKPRPRACSPTWPSSPTREPPWPPPTTHRHPGHGRRRGPCRRLLDDRDRRMGRRHPQPGRARLGARHHAPGHCSVPAEATIRRTLSAWTSTPWPPRSAPGFPTAAASSSAAGQSRSMAGRCEAKRDGRQVHLLACMDHTTRAVLAQRQVDGAPVRSPPSNPLLAGLDLPGGHHRRRTAHPPGRRRVPGHPKAGPSRRPHPRPRPRPRRAPHPQGRHRQPLRLPARRPGPAGHPQGL